MITDPPKVRYDEHLESLERRGKWFAALFGLALVATIAVTAWADSREPETWDPLGPFPVQIVRDSDLTIDVTVEMIKVEATKCREGTDGIQVVGNLAWRRVTPPGFTSAIVEFAPSIQSNGCTVETFENAIPEAVRVDVCLNGSSDWQVTGSELPIGDVVEGRVVSRTGELLGWETEVFTLTCE